MELDLYTDNFLLEQVWDLDLPFVQPDGQYGDLKPVSRHEDDLYKENQLQGSFEEPKDNGEDLLGLEWMESDLSTFLDVLDSSEKVLPLEGTLLPHGLSTGTEPSVIQEKSSLWMQDALLDDLDQGTLPTDQGVPASPSASRSLVEVSPVIKLEGLDMLEALSPNASDSIINPADFISRSELQSVSSIDDLQLSPVPSPAPTEASKSRISSPGPSSPESNLSSLVETSPELYKIITTSENARFSPYSAPKAKQNSKVKSVRKRKPAEPIPEHVIMEHLNKKDRKKMQNKNAAIRYRMKKKEEATCIKSEEQELQDVNSSLKTKVEDLEREIKYMKNLMEEVYKARGISLK